jgi:uncharacterized protein (TIGR02466 family)
MPAELKAHVWFPTLIWQADMPDNEKSFIKDIKNYVLKEKKATPDTVKMNNGKYGSVFQGGWQSKTYTQWIDGFEHMGKKLDETIESCRKQIGVPEIKLKGYWFSVNSYGDYTTLHNHRDSVLSGVFYVDIPDENMGKINFERSDDISYFLPPLESYNNFTGERASYQPETGRVLIFPSWLKHSVDANRSKKNRISVSFNYGV